MPFGVSGELGYLMLGVALGAIPSRKLSDVAVAWIASKLGVKPGDIRAYDEATSDGGDGGGKA